MAPSSGQISRISPIFEKKSLKKLKKTSFLKYLKYFVLVLFMNTENSLKLETKVKNLSRSIISKTIVRQNNEIVIKYQLQYGYIQCYFKLLNAMFTPGRNITVEPKSIFCSTGNNIFTLDSVASVLFNNKLYN